MKKSTFYIFIILLMSVVSCQTRIVDQQKPLHANTLELYHKYTIQTNDGKVQKINVLKQDDTNIYGQDKNGADVTISKNEVREIKKFDWISSVIIGAGAVAALIFIPV